MLQVEVQHYTTFQYIVEVTYISIVCWYVLLHSKSFCLRHCLLFAVLEWIKVYLEQCIAAQNQGH